MSPNRLSNRLLAGILLLTLAVRLWGIDFGLPYTYHTDEGTVIRRALSFGTGDLNPHSFHWPALHVYLLSVVYGVLYGIGVLLGFFHSVADYRNLYFTDATLFYLAGRLLSAALGTTTVYWVYRIASRMAGVRAGLFAALCLALTYYHVWDSHIATLDVPMALWVTLCFAASLDILTVPEVSLHRYLAAGTLAGLATATKYNGGIVFLAVVAAHALRPSRPRLFPLAASALAAAATFLVTNPFVLIDWHTFLRDFAFQKIHLAEGPWGLATEPAWRYYLDHLVLVPIKNTELVLFDPMGLLFVAGLLGLGFGGRRRENLLLLVVPIAYVAYVGRWEMAATRYLEPILPLLAVASGIWIARLPRPAVAAAGLALCLSLRTVVIADVIRSTADTRSESKQWFEQHVAPKAMVAIESYDPPLAASPETIDELARAITDGDFRHPTQSVERMKQFYRWMKDNAPDVTYRLVLLNDTLLDADAAAINRAPQTNYDLERLQTLGVQYVIVNSFQYNRFLTDHARALYPKRAGFYETLQETRPLVKEFRPEPWQPGPVIRVYSLEAAS